MRNESSQNRPRALLDFEGAATYLDDSPRHLRRLVQERRIPFTRVGAKIRFSVSDLDAYIKDRTVEAVS